MIAAIEFPLVPERASSMAGQTDYLFYALCALTLVMLAVVFLPMFFFPVSIPAGERGRPDA